MKPRIVVPFDFSDTAERALAWAADFQRTTNAPALHIVHAISSRPAGATALPVERMLPDEDEIAKLEGAMLEKARRAEASATAAVWIRASKVADIILDATASEKAELVVMGSHGRSGVRRIILGSVAEHVLRHAKCPVVTVHALNGHGK